MTDEQNIADIWLSRMADSDGEIIELEERRDKLANQGVMAYDADKVHGGSDPNPAEARYIEYSYICGEIERKSTRLANENIRTHKVIDQVSNALYRELLVGHYLNNKTWEQAGKVCFYEKTRARELGYEALTAVYPFIPKEEVLLSLM